MIESRKVEDALRAVRDARLAYQMAHKAANVARNLETEALNNLNGAQKAFDAAVAELRVECGGGDWSHPKRSGIDA